MGGLDGGTLSLLSSYAKTLQDLSSSPHSPPAEAIVYEW